MRHAATVLAAIMLSSCSGMADLRGPPPGTAAESAAPVDPETVKADARLFPTFRIAEAINPPRWISPRNPNFKSRYPMVDILPTDEWIVRHTVGDLLIITSEAYDARQREALSRMGPGSDGNYIYGVFIAPDGRVSGGWILLKNPRAVILASERRTYLTPSPWGNDGWENIRFERAK